MVGTSTLTRTEDAVYVSIKKELDAVGICDSSDAVVWGGGYEKDYSLQHAAKKGNARKREYLPVSRSIAGTE